MGLTKHPDKPKGECVMEFRDKPMQNLIRIKEKEIPLNTANPKEINVSIACGVSLRIKDRFCRASARRPVFFYVCSVPGGVVVAAVSAFAGTCMKIEKSHVCSFSGSDMGLFNS